MSQQNQTDFGFTNVNKEEKVKLVKGVFNSVAPKYDVMNDLMSLGMHRLWKKFTFITTDVKPGAKVLDIAGGTGDISLGFNKLVGDKGQVWHTDINAAMLKTGKKRLINQGIVLPQCLCNAEALPFADGYFDIVCVSFGLRNMTDKAKALKEMHRVLAIDGVLLVLEFSKVNKILKPLYDLYSFKVLPKLGQIVAGDSNSYKYLAESIRMHPDQENLKQLMLDSGFKTVKYHNLTFGVTALHKAYKV